jgi:tyrosyl-tRNA synthetase
MGHEILCLIGDFTAAIGDPTGKSKTRPELSREAIIINTQTYLEQVSKVLSKENFKLYFNSEWLSKLDAADMLKLCAKVTVARLIEREDFANRLESNSPIGFHELFYPLMQGYDSVVLKADVELGGTDQTFNLLMGRFLQEQYGQEPQVIMTLPLLEGLDGVEKMSKSLGNYIGLSETPQDAYGKLMSISDVLMWRYYEVLLLTSLDDIAAMQQRINAGIEHPLDLKKSMAHQILSMFWSPADADIAQQYFETIFQKKDLSQAQEVTLSAGLTNPLWIVDLLKELGAIKTSSEAKRLIETNAVVIDGQAVTDFKALIGWKSGMIIKVGKHRIYKIA